MTVELGERVAYERFGEMVGITRQAVAASVAAGVLDRDGTLAEWLRAYCENLRRHAAGRAIDPDLAAQRTRLARERADQIEIRNRRSRRELAPVGVLEAALAAVCRRIAAALEAVPSQLKRRSTGLTQADLEFVEAEITKARNLAAGATLTIPELQELADSVSEPAAGSDFD